MTIYHIVLKYFDSIQSLHPPMDKSGSALSPPMMGDCPRGKLVVEKCVSIGDSIGFDMKMVVLACLRIAAVNHDIELKQDMYTKVYYESAVRD